MAFPFIQLFTIRIRINAGFFLQLLFTIRINMPCWVVIIFKNHIPVTTKTTISVLVIVKYRCFSYCYSCFPIYKPYDELTTRHLGDKDQVRKPCSIKLRFVIASFFDKTHMELSVSEQRSVSNYSVLVFKFSRIYRYAIRRPLIWHGSEWKKAKLKSRGPGLAGVAYSSKCTGGLWTICLVHRSLDLWWSHIFLWSVSLLW